MERESEIEEESTTSKEENQVSFLLQEPADFVMQMEGIHGAKEERKLEDMDQLMQPPPSQSEKESLLLSMLSSSLEPVENKEYM